MKPHALLTIVATAILVGPLAFGGGSSDQGAASPALPAAAGAFDFHRISLVSRAVAEEHGLLVDKHSAAGLACTSCHAESVFTDPVPVETCTQCHGTYAEIAALTPWEPNPHQSHMGELACTMCHNVHKPSVSFCDECHSFGMQVP